MRPARMARLRAIERQVRPLLDGTLGEIYLADAAGELGESVEELRWKLAAVEAELKAAGVRMDRPETVEAWCDANGLDYRVFMAEVNEQAARWTALAREVFNR